MKRHLLPAILLLTLGAVACSAPSAQDMVGEVIEQRNNYEAQASSWIIRDQPTPHIYLDVMVINNNEAVALKTLTVMVEQLDADDNVLNAQRVPIDTAQLTPGIGQGVGVQVTPVAEGIEAVRLYIERAPAEDVWPEFPEFNAVRPRV
jgi:hypothetical protein